MRYVFYISFLTLLGEITMLKTIRKGSLALALCASFSAHGLEMKSFDEKEIEKLCTSEGTMIAIEVDIATEYVSILEHTAQLQNEGEVEVLVSMDTPVLTESPDDIVLVKCSTEGEVIYKGRRIPYNTKFSIFINSKNTMDIKTDINFGAFEL